jgi:hypothetical protein
MRNSLDSAVRSRMLCRAADIPRNRMIKTITGYLCLALGVVGLALPLLPGIPLLIVGVALLGPQHPVRRFLARWRPRRNRDRS